MNTVPQVFMSHLASDHPADDCACVDDTAQSVADGANEAVIGFAWANSSTIGTGSSAGASNYPPVAQGPPNAQLMQAVTPCNSLPITDDHILLLFEAGVQARIVIVNQAAARLLAMFEQPRDLEESFRTLTIMEREAVQCLVKVGAIQRTLVRTLPRHEGACTLVAWLHLTDKCNLCCHYCYAHRSEAALSLENGRAIIDALMEMAVRNGMARVKLKYAGGEPLLHFRMLEEIHTYAERQATAQQLHLNAVLLTNGVTLPPRALDYLRDHHMDIMISLDGLGSVHDASRPAIDTRSSFQRTLQTIERVQSSGLAPTISVTITRLNCKGLASLVSFFLERDLRFHLNFYRDHGGSTATDLRPRPEELLICLQQVFAVIEQKLPRRRIIDSLVDRASFQSPHVHPCGVGQNYVVIDTSGNMARCHMEMTQIASSIWSNDPLGNLRAAATPWRNIPVLEKNTCRDCEWRAWCAGGCPLLTMRTTGRVDLPSPYCDVYKEIFPAALRLEGLRVLKWERPLVGEFVAD